MRRLWRWFRSPGPPFEEWSLGGRCDDGKARDVAWIELIRERGPA